MSTLRRCAPNARANCSTDSAVITLYDLPVTATTYLVTVSGPDRPGVASRLFEAVAQLGDDSCTINDVAQITIRGYLVLCVELSVDATETPERLRERTVGAGVVGDGIDVAVTVVEPGEFVNGKRLLVTFLAPSVTSEALKAVFGAIANSGATCERIVHLASYPVDCYELVVRGPNHTVLREALTLAASDVGLDLAVQRAGLHRRSKHLVVMDADSTLLQDEVIDLLADACGCVEEVAAITDAAMAGTIDFAEALRQRVALLKGLPVSVLDDVRAQLRLTPGARTLLRTLQRLGYVPAVVSGGFVEVLAPLLTELGVDLLEANRLEVIDGKLSGHLASAVLDRAGKARALVRFAATVGVPLQQTVAVGDGANDIDMLSAAGLGIAFNAKAVVREHADTALSVPYLDAVLYFLGISREEIDAE
jgi:phosphoserine phosphatase